MKNDGVKNPSAVALDPVREYLRSIGSKGGTATAKNHDMKRISALGVAARKLKKQKRL